MPRTNGTLQSRPETFGGKPTIRDTRLKVETVLLSLFMRPGICRPQHNLYKNRTPETL